MMSDHESVGGAEDRPNRRCSDEFEQECEMEETNEGESVLGGSKPTLTSDASSKRKPAKPRVTIDIVDGCEYLETSMVHVKKHVSSMFSTEASLIVKEIIDILEPFNLKCLPNLFVTSCVEVTLQCYERKSTSVYQGKKIVEKQSLVYSEKISKFSVQILSQILNLFRPDSVDEFEYDACLGNYELSSQRSQCEPLENLFNGIKNFLLDSKDGKNILSFLRFSDDIGRISTQGESKTSLALFVKPSSRKGKRKKSKRKSDSDYSGDEESSSEEDDVSVQQNKETMKKRSDLISKIENLADELKDFLYMFFAVFVVNVLFPHAKDVHYTSTQKVGQTEVVYYKIKIDSSRKFPYLNWQSFDSEFFSVSQYLVFELRSFLVRFRRNKDQLCGIKFLYLGLIKNVFSQILALVTSDFYGDDTFLNELLKKLFESFQNLSSKNDIIIELIEEESKPEICDDASESSDSAVNYGNLLVTLKHKVDQYVCRLKSMNPVKSVSVSSFDADDLLAIEASLRFLKKSPVPLSNTLSLLASSAHNKVLTLLTGASQTPLEIPNIRNFTARPMRKQRKSSPRASLNASHEGSAVPPVSDAEASVSSKRRPGMRMLQSIGINLAEVSCLESESERPKREVKPRDMFKVTVAEPKAKTASSVGKKEDFKRGLEIPGLSDFKEYDPKKPLRVVAPIGNTKLEKIIHGKNVGAMKAVPFYCEIKEKLDGDFFRVSDYVGPVDPTDEEKSYIVHESLITELGNTNVKITNGALDSTRIPSHYFYRNDDLVVVHIDPTTKVQNVVGSYPMHNYWPTAKIREKISEMPKPLFSSLETSAPNPTQGTGRRRGVNKALLQPGTDQNTTAGEGREEHSIVSRKNLTNQRSSRTSGVDRSSKNIEKDGLKDQDEKASSESSDEGTSSMFTKAMKLKLGYERKMIERNLKTATSGLSIDEASFDVLYSRRMWGSFEGPEIFEIQTKKDLNSGGYKIIPRKKENARIEQEREGSSDDEYEDDDEDQMSMDEQDFVYDIVMPDSQIYYATRGNTCVSNDHQKETQALFPLNPRIKIFVFTVSMDLNKNGENENVIFIAPRHFHGNRRYFRFIHRFLYGNGFMEPSQPFLELVVQSDIEIKKCIHTIKGFKFSEYDFKDWLHCYKVVGSEQSLLDRVREFVDSTYGDDARYTVKTMWTLCLFSPSPYCHGCNGCFLKPDIPLEELFSNNYKLMSGYLPRYCDLLYERPPCAGMKRGHRFHFHRPGDIQKVEVVRVVEDNGDSVEQSVEEERVCKAVAIEWPFGEGAADVSMEASFSGEVASAQESQNAPTVEVHPQQRRSSRKAERTEIAPISLSSETRATQKRSENIAEVSEVEAPRERKTRSSQRVKGLESESESESVRRSTRSRKS